MGAHAMTTNIQLDGKDYEEGSAAHLQKIDEMHKAEIAQNAKAHVQDITERKDLEDRARVLNEEVHDEARERTATLADARLERANAAIRQCESRFRLLVNGVKDYALFTLDPSGNVASWNAGAERIKGYKAREILGKHFSLFYEPADVRNGRPQNNLAAAAETGRAEDEGWRVRKDGSIFWANVVLAPIRDPAGVVLGFAKVTHDLTERRELEEQLHQA
jgi:PAS domain S-box-containing protein